MPLDFGGIEAEIRGLAPAATLAGAEHLKQVSQTLAPIETGRLVGSAEARPAGEMRAEVVYPGPYARYQHYGPHFDPWVLHHEHGQGLYLETPTVTEADACTRIVADGIKGAFA
jgi:protocatechuate 3,4-dioxygenase beta subunit